MLLCNLTILLSHFNYNDIKCKRLQSDILFYFILFLFYFILFYFILFYFILFYFILFYFILFYFILEPIGGSGISADTAKNVQLLVDAAAEKGTYDHYLQRLSTVPLELKGAKLTLYKVAV